MKLFGRYQQVLFIIKNLMELMKKLPYHIKDLRDEQEHIHISDCSYVVHRTNIVVVGFLHEEFMVKFLALKGPTDT